MSKIYVTTNTSILVFVSTCKQITQSEPTEFSKNGVFHSKAAVIIFSNCSDLIPTLPHMHRPIRTISVDEMRPATLRHFTPLLYKTYRNRISEKFLLTDILDI